MKKQTTTTAKTFKPKNLRIVEEKRWVDTYGTGDKQSYSVFSIYRDLNLGDIYDIKLSRGRLLRSYFTKDAIKQGVRIETVRTREFAKFIIDGIKKRK